MAWPTDASTDDAVRPLEAVPLTRGLTFKQAAITLLVVLALGLALGALQLFLDWRAMRAEVRENLDHTLDLVEGSATEALYQLHRELGRQVVDGLFVFETVRRVELRDDFGRTLARRERTSTSSAGWRDWGWLFADVAHVQRPLRHAEGSGPGADVGVLEVELSPHVLAQRFLRQALRDALFGIARAVFISALVVILFYFMITRPLLSLSRAIAAVDPARPGHWRPPPLAGHARDELGLLLAHLRRLFVASQEGLDQRDQAQRELTRLTQDLERRVLERTQALERALSDLEQRKGEVERAFGELGATHQRLSEANHRLLESHCYARRIQNAMLPDAMALGEVGEVRIHWEPLHQVGGDWYWLERRGDRCLMLLADCTGHGVPGAFITLVLASATEQVLREMEPWEPAEILMALDGQLRHRLRQDRSQDARGGDSDDGLDAAVLVWDVRARTLDFAGVGGIPLLRLDPDGHVATFRGTRGHLGYQSLAPPATIATERIEVPPGAVCYLMTDGIPDQMGGSPRRLLGRRRVAHWLAANVGLGLADQIEGLCRMLDDYRGGESRRDDMTLLAFRPFDSRR